MHPRKMFALAGGECCQCENVATTKSNSQFSGDIAAADKLELATLELATLPHFHIQHERRIQACREGNDGQPSHDFSGVMGLATKNTKGTEK